MIRWLSELWASRALDRGQRPPRLWVWTFGRLASHRRAEARLRELDGQLRRQATSQQRANVRQPYPVGRYTSRRAVDDAVTVTERAGLFASGGSGWRRPVLAYVGGGVALGLAAWFAWPTPPPIDPTLPAKFERSLTKVWDPIARQAQQTELALRDQTAYVAALPQRVPKLDTVVNELGEAIETPIRTEMQRFADDMTRPWAYLAGQLPLPRRESAPVQEGESRELQG